MNNELTFCDYNRIFLDKSWEWLHDKEIKILTNTPDFTKQEQLAFFNSLNQKEDYFIKGICINQNPVGAAGLKKINNNDAEYWGYIGEKEYWGKGFGVQIIDYMANKAESLSLKSIYLFVIKENSRAIKLYQKKGFIIESENEDELKMRLKL